MALPQKKTDNSPDAEASQTAEGAQPRASLTAVPQASGGPQLIHLKKGDLLFAEGHHSRAMYLVKSGVLRIFKKKGEASIEIDTIRAGQIVGELAFLDGNSRSASAEALTECELIEVSGPAFQSVLTEMPDWLKILLKTIVGRLRTASTRIRQLESASTAVDYSKQNGKRSTSYVFLGTLDVLKILTGLLLIASRHGKRSPNGKEIEIPLDLTTRYINQIMGIPEAKITTLVDVLIQADVMAFIEDHANLANSRTVLKDMDFLEKLIIYLNNENLAASGNRHDLSPRAFYIMSLIAKHLKLFKKHEQSGYIPVNLHMIRKAEASAEGKEPFRMHEFQSLVSLGYATEIDFRSANEAITLINEKELLQALRFQRVCICIQAANERKQK